MPVSGGISRTVGRAAGSVAFGLLLVSVAWAQSNDLPALSASEQQALELITERNVTGTIAFLASDEMGGRGTPSPEYRIATAYVAARFAAAGLRGGGPDESFYQTTEVETIQFPTEGIVWSVGGPRVPYGLLVAGKTAVQFQGELVTVDPQSEQPLSGAVVLPYNPSFGERAGIRELLRTVESLGKRGATAVILPVPADSNLLALAAANRARPQTAGRGGGGGALPVLLVRAEDPLSGPCELTIPPAVVATAEVRNVIGVLPGSDPNLASEAIVFSAHLDHLGIRPGEPDPVYNGADDDASGVTAVLALADAFGALEPRPRRTVIFLTFWGKNAGYWAPSISLNIRSGRSRKLWPTSTSK